MTEKQLYAFCKKESDRLMKENNATEKKYYEIRDKEGEEKAEEYAEKFHIVERWEFFSSCRNALKNIIKNKDLIDGKDWIKNIKNKFATKLEKVIKGYDPDNNKFEDFKKLTSEFRDKDEYSNAYIYDSMFNDNDFVNNIDIISDYREINKIINKFRIAIGVCYKSANRKLFKNKLLEKDCKALERATEKLANMDAEARLNTEDLRKYYESALDMIDEYLYAKKIYDSLSNKLKNKTDKEAKEWGIEENVKYFPY